MAKKIYLEVEDIQTPVCDVESQETTISWSRFDDIATVFTSDPTTVTRFKNLMKEDPCYKCYVYINGDGSEKPSGYHFEFDRSLVSFRRKTGKRELSEEEKLDISMRLRKNK